MTAPVLIPASKLSTSHGVVEATMGSQVYLYILMINSCLGGFLFGYDTVRRRLSFFHRDTIDTHA